MKNLNRVYLKECLLFGTYLCPFLSSSFPLYSIFISPSCQPDRWIIIFCQSTVFFSTSVHPDTNFLSVNCLIVTWPVNTNFLAINCLFFPSFYPDTNFLTFNCLFLPSCYPIIISCPVTGFLSPSFYPDTNFLPFNCLFLPSCYPILISCPVFLSPSFHPDTNFLFINCLIVTLLLSSLLNTNFLPINRLFLHFLSSYTNFLSIKCLFLSFLSSYTNFLPITCFFSPSCHLLLISCPLTVFFSSSCHPAHPLSVFHFSPSLQRSPLQDSRYVLSKGVNMEVTPP